ncbi:MAG: GNAT family N-acetyltransferase [Bacteroidales bacterium]|jgi:ribosomal protein S18 acetylase RimI-like enzyme
MKIKKINRFSRRVFEAVLRLLPQVASNEELPAKQYFKSILTSENVHFFIAELDNKQIVGMLTIGTYLTPSGAKVWIEDVVVDETQRGKGIGKEMMLFAINYSGSLGAKTIGLTSRPSRTAANKLYQKLGFTRYETNVYKYLLR